MTIKDTVVGKYYHITDENNSTELIIQSLGIESCGTKLSGPCISNMNGNWKLSARVYTPGRVIREATLDEELWLEKCIHLGKFVQRETVLLKNGIINIYSIY